MTDKKKDAVRQLTAADSIRIENISGVDGEEESDVEIARLAMLARGESPNPANRVKEILDMPAAEFLAFTVEARKQINDAPDPVYEGLGATVGEYNVRPLTGRDLRLLASDPVKCVVSVTGLSMPQVRKLPIGIYTNLLTAVAFLGSEAVAGDPVMR